MDNGYHSSRSVPSSTCTYLAASPGCLCQVPGPCNPDLLLHTAAQLPQDIKGSAAIRWLLFPAAAAPAGIAAAR